MSFSNSVSFTQLNFHNDIMQAITACGYQEPTPIQAQSIPVIIAGKDVVASARTGTGKTAAFVLPALQYLATQPRNKKTRILILTPTRELANQITTAAHAYGKYLRFNIVSLVGGMPYHHQIRDLNRGADIIVATPGRLIDHINSNRVNLSNIDLLVLDEADRMLDMGFIDDVQHIASLTPERRQTLLFSATMDKELMNVTRHLLKNPMRIDLANEKIASPQIRQELYRTNNAHQKNQLLKSLLADGNVFKAIIFSATKINADKLAEQLRYDGFSAAALHGDLRQNVRNRTIEQLRRGKIQFLVATDVAARGIDIDDVTHVINYDLPRFCEDYVHRIGRTGRAGKTGIAISFALPSDSKHLQRIEKFVGQRLKLVHAPTNNAENGSASQIRKSDNLVHAKDYKQSSYKDSKSDKHRHSKHSNDERVSIKHERKSNDEFKPRRHSSANDEFRAKRSTSSNDEFKPKRHSSANDESKTKRNSSSNDEFKTRRNPSKKFSFKKRKFAEGK